MRSLEPPVDLAFGAFSDEPPWTIPDPDDLVWRRGLDPIRAATRAEVPRLTRRRAIPPLRRVVLVGFRLVRALAGWALHERRRREDDPSASRAGLSRRLREAFEALGPTYIKLGQIVSSGEGIFPDELVSEFRLLRDRVQAEPWDVVRRTIELDLGAPIDEVFEHFDRDAIASASVAQVYAARLRTGEDVVVKVQRSQVATLVRRDLAAMSWIAPVLVGRIPIAALANPPALVELFAETIVEELDFRLEAENMLDVAGVLAATDQRAIVVPRPHPKLVTPRVLVMERLDGFTFDDVEGMRAAGIDTGAVLRAGVIASMEGAMLFGIFHGDLHGGNLFVQPDGRTALLDFGITGRLDEPRRLALLRLLMSGTMNDVRGQIAAFRDLGALPADVDVDQLMVDLGVDQPVKDPTQMEPDELMAEIREITKKLLGYGARFPKELMLFVKNMLFTTHAVATMAPDIDIFAEITHIAGYFANRHGDRITADVGIDPRTKRPDLAGMRASMGLPDSVESITPRELMERRRLIQKRMTEHRRGRGRGRR